MGARGKIDEKYKLRNMTRGNFSDRHMCDRNGDL